MRDLCPSELEFTTAIERVKESLRKTRQRHKENLEHQRESQISKILKFPFISEWHGQSWVVPLLPFISGLS
jgi:hypothetical protein